MPARSLTGRIARALLYGLLALILVLAALLLALRFVPPPTTAFMLDYRFSGAPAPLRQDWVPLQSMSPWLPLAVVASEDQRFFEHWGLDTAAISQALEEYRRGQGLRGASTLSQQTAKNLFLWQDQSLLRKGLEAGLTLLIEALWDKQRILEVYLNVAEFGPGIYGVEAASRHYFDLPAAALNARQASLLAAVLPSPKRMRPMPPSPYVRERAAWIRQQMRQLGGTGFLQGRL